MLRLQSELHKTVVFVTHDIDEAIKLGDKVAVFDPAAHCSSTTSRRGCSTTYPANEFVAGFIGADRGYRGLQFFGATGLLHTSGGSRGPDRRSALGDGDWVVVTKPDGTPYALDQRQRCGAPSRRQFLVRQHYCRRLAVRSRTGRYARRWMPRCRHRRVWVSPSTVTDRCSAALADDVLAALKTSEAGRAIPADASRRRPGADLIHLRLSLIPIVLGLLIAVPLGALVQRTTVLRRMTTVTASIIFTIPSLALFVVLPLIIPTRILDEANVIVALTLYTAALLVRAVPEALDAVPAPVRDAATAVGYKPLTRMLKVELPLSIPVLVAGLRVVAVTNISMVSVGSVIGIGGLGTWFTEGYQADKSDQIIAGIIAIFVLAIVIDTLIMLAGGRSPRGPAPRGRWLKAGAR